MNKLEGLTFEQFVAEKEKAINEEGYAETQTIENVPVGATSGKPQIVTAKVNGKMVKSPSFSIIPFVRKDAEGKEVKLLFCGVKFDVTHLSSGKSFNGVVTKATDELIEKLNVSTNLTKSHLFDSVAYGTAGRTILKYQGVE